MEQILHLENFNYCFRHFRPLDYLVFVQSPSEMISVRNWCPIPFRDRKTHLLCMFSTVEIFLRGISLCFRYVAINKKYPVCVPVCLCYRWLGKFIAHKGLQILFWIKKSKLNAPELQILDFVVRFFIIFC